MQETGKLQLQLITASGLEELARFIGRLSGSDTPPPRAVERLSWILLDNPARDAAHPLGWLLRAPTGELVGCMCCAPQLFYLGKTTFTVMMANSFYVDDQHRGAGTSIFLKYVQLAHHYPLFVSSANPTVAEIWHKLGGYPIENSGHEIFGILRWPPLLAESVYRKTASDRLARLTVALVSPWLRAGRQLLPETAEGELQPIYDPEEAAIICASHRSDKITSCRNALFLRWRYFSKVDPTTRVFAFRPRNEDKKQFMVAVRAQNRGYKQQIRALQVLDIWGEADPHLCLAIASSLWREYRDQIDILAFRCLNPAQQRALTDRGFKVRSFGAPIAWCMDKRGLLPSKVWYLVPADGDMFL